MLYLNLSTIGPRLTGLGVYSRVCAGIVEGNFDCRVFHNRFFRDFSDCSIPTPDNISIGFDRLAAFRRVFFKSPGELGPDDLLYCPTHHSFFPPEKSIITIHDLISVHHPKQHPLQYLFFAEVLRRKIKQYRAIFTVSDVSKADIVDFYGVEPRSVHVVPNMVSFQPFSGELLRRRKFLLCVGASFPHKNIEEVLYMHSKWAREYSLVIVSSTGAYRNKLEKLVSQLRLSEVVEIFGFVDKQFLAQLYASCSALVYPSLCEGFGIPPLEAAAHGRPAIVSDIPVHREIFADSVVYVRLGDPSSWGNALESLVDPEHLDFLHARASNNLHRFSLENVSSALVAAIKAA